MEDTNTKMSSKQTKGHTKATSNRQQKYKQQAHQQTTRSTKKNQNTGLHYKKLSVSFCCTITGYSKYDVSH